MHKGSFDRRQGKEEGVGKKRKRKVWTKRERGGHQEDFAGGKETEREGKGSTKRRTAKRKRMRVMRANSKVTKATIEEYATPAWCDERERAPPMLCGAQSMRHWKKGPMKTFPIVEAQEEETFVKRHEKETDSIACSVSFSPICTIAGPGELEASTQHARTSSRTTAEGTARRLALEGEEECAKAGRNGSVAIARSGAWRGGRGRFVAVFGPRGGAGRVAELRKEKRKWQEDAKQQTANTKGKQRTSRKKGPPRKEKGNNRNI